MEGEYLYVYVDGVYLKRCWDGEIENVWVLVAIGINKDGYREILGAAEGMKAESLSCSRKQGRNQRKSRILTERVNREIKRRTRAIGAFPDGNTP